MSDIFKSLTIPVELSDKQYYFLLKRGGWFIGNINSIDEEVLNVWDTISKKRKYIKKSDIVGCTPLTRNRKHVSPNGRKPFILGINDFDK